ncbi:MAG TPA: diguanylate cyclase response regulator [Planctomycetales bacterium]|nr:diguanylate cyclase response regulator [Planctomycetales bacterium]
MRILIAEDDPVSRRLLEATLVRWDYEVVVACDGPSALEILQRDDAPSLGLLDLIMPGMNGDEICRKVRERFEGKYVYLLLLTANSHKADLIHSLNAGADDYLVKPVDPMELKARLNTGRRILELQEQLIAARDAMRRQAMRDSLTGAWNHAAILDILRSELHRGQREGGSLSVVLADLDHFKDVNDTFGHLAGDEALCEAYRRMANAMRPYDMIGRYGGEEFLIVLPGCDEVGALHFCERLRGQIGDTPIAYKGEEITVTVSVGAVVHEHGEAADCQALLQAADQALYRAKRSGRNRMEIASEIVSV